MPTLAVTWSGREPWLNWASPANCELARRSATRREAWFGADECKRVAPQTRDHVATADLLFDHAGRLPQDDVAPLMPVFVVDVRERIEVDEHDRGQRPAAGLAKPRVPALLRAALRFGSEVSRSVCVKMACICTLSACVAILRSAVLMCWFTSSVASRICVTALDRRASLIVAVLKSPLIFCSRCPCPLIWPANSVARTSSDEST